MNSTLSKCFDNSSWGEAFAELRSYLPSAIKSDTVDAATIPPYIHQFIKCGLIPGSAEPSAVGAWATKHIPDWSGSIAKAQQTGVTNIGEVASSIAQQLACARKGNEAYLTALKGGLSEP